MQGAYGGPLVWGDGVASEQVDPRVATLVGSDGEPVRDGNLVPIRQSGPGSLEYRGDLRHLGPLAPCGATPVTLATVAEAVLALHDAGRPHGDLRPAHVWVNGDEVRVTYPARPAPGSDFVAPELRAPGAPITDESDVYAFAALVLFGLAGAPTLDRATVLPEHVRVLVARAMNPNPAARPSLRELRDALLAVPLGPSVGAPGEAADVGASCLQILPVGAAIGVLVAFLLALASKVLAIFVSGHPGTIAMGPLFLGSLVVVTAGYVVFGLAGHRLGERVSGIVLLTSAAQLLWFDAIVGFTTLPRYASKEAWLVVAVGIGLLTGLLARRTRSAILRFQTGIALAIASALLIDIFVFPGWLGAVFGRAWRAYLSLFE